MSRNEKKWRDVAHLLLTNDQEYMEKVNTEERITKNQVLKNYISKGFEQHSSYIKSILYLDPKITNRTLRDDDYQILAKFIGSSEEEIYDHITWISIHKHKKMSLNPINSAFPDLLIRGQFAPATMLA